MTSATKTLDIVETIETKDLQNATVDQIGPPPAQDFYDWYYTTAQRSQAYALFCQRAYGRNFLQHGFADMNQIHFMLSVLQLQPCECVLDLGCGAGGIAEYVSEVTGAEVTGVDFAPTAIRLAQQRTAGKAHRLEFHVADIGDLPFEPNSFDAIMSIDTLYFTDMESTVARLKALLAPGGQMAILYSHGADPWTPIESFPRETLPANATPLGMALQHLGLRCQIWDITADDFQHAQRAREVLLELQPQFEAEGTLGLYENRLNEANGIIAAVEANAHARYLYLVQRDAARKDCADWAD